MRRKDKEIIDKNEIDIIIENALVCRIGLCDGGMPYIVPMSFGYEYPFIYLHSFFKGRKIDIVKKNPNVCFEFDTDVRVVKNRDTCSWSMNYKSVVGFGIISIIENAEDKKNALDVIMKQYTKNKSESFEYDKNKLALTTVMRMEITSISAKQSGFKG